MNAILSIEQIAAVCHEANRSLCANLGDMSQKPWALAEKWQRDSAIQGVKFRLDNPTALPGTQHESWFEQKVADGWKYGPVKDAEKKEHPCMVPFTQLPLEQQAKDHLFIAVVDSLKHLLI